MVNMRAGDSRMTGQDVPPSLSIIAERHLARVRAALEERGVDTADMPVAEIFDRSRGDREPAKAVSREPDRHRPSRSWRPERPARWDRAWRRGWRRSRSKNPKHTPEQG